MNKYFSFKMHVASLFCTSLIAFSHSYNTFSYLHDSSLPAYDLFSRISSLAYISMTYFFFMSSYWLFRTYHSSQYLEKLKSRFHSILVPYIIFCIIGWIIMIIINNGEVKINITTFLDGICNSAYNGPLWYLLKIYFLFILSPLLFYIIKHKKICIICCAILVSFNYYRLPIYNSLQFWLPVYLIGGWTSYHYHTSFEKFIGHEDSLHSHIWAFSGCLLLLFLSIIGAITEVNAQYFYLTRMLCLPIVMLVFASMPIKGELPISIQHSVFLLYCLHLPLRCIYGMLFDLFPISSSFTLCISVFLLMGMVYITAYGLSSLLYKHKNKLFLIVTGGR